MTEHLMGVVAELYGVGHFGRLDLELARSLSRISGERDPLVLLGVAVASRAVSQGHVCAELRAIVGESPVDRDGVPVAGLAWPDLDDWLEALRRSPLVGDGDGVTPLVLTDGRLYSSRYHTYERRLARALLERASGSSLPIDAALLARDIALVFPERDGWQFRQALAAVAAVRGRVTVVTGGPGTGKTAVVVRILALLVSQALAAGRSLPRIELLAPTGKAAARLIESITASVDTLDIDGAITAGIPREAATIHRRLGSRSADPTRFVHDADNPLFADIVVVDEASMVDIGLMSRLVDAVSPEARLVLLGDQDQLASVEAGAILGDICLAGGDRPGHSSELLDAARAAIGGLPTDLVAGGEDAPLADRVIELTRSRRFDARSPIGRLAVAVRDGDGPAARAMLEPAGELGWRSGGGEGGGREGVFALETAADFVPVGFLDAFVVPPYRRVLAPLDGEAEEEAQVRAAFAAFARFRVLCAHRRGPFGVEALNRRIERVLSAVGLQPVEGHYPFRPVMVTRNDYQLELFNGDIGIVLPDASDPSRLRAWFETGDGGLRRVPAARLPVHETCWAMTVHKSQGSEFERIALVLPNRPSPVLTRELVYTAVTRAREAVVILTATGVLEDAVARRVMRASGLRQALWGTKAPDQGTTS